MYKKILGSTIIFLTLCAVSSVIAKTPTVSYNGSEITMNIVGKTEPESLVTLIITDDENKEKNIVYIDAFKTDKYGSYSHKFKTEYNPNCRILLRQGDEDIYDSITAVNIQHLCSSELYLDVADNSAKVVIDNVLGNDSQIDVVLGCYAEDGTLKKIRVLKNINLKFDDRNKVIEIFDVPIDEDLYKLKAFVFESTSNIRPLSQIDEEINSYRLKTAADGVFCCFEPTNETETEIKNLYLMGEYKAALIGLKEILLQRFRDADFCYLENKYLSYNSDTAVSDILIGEMTIPEYIVRFPAQMRKTDFPAEELNGTPYRATEYNWVNGWAESIDSDGNHTNLNLLPSQACYNYCLTGRFLQTNEKKYADKMLVLQSLWFKNGKSQADEYKKQHTKTPEKDRGIYFNDDIVGYSHQTSHCYAVLKCMAAIADRDINMLDEVYMAEIIGGMLENQLPYIKKCIDKPQPSPNLQQTATQDISKIINILDCFSVCSELKDTAFEKMADNLDNYWYKDGGYLEEHLNYAEAAYKSLENEAQFYLNLGVSNAYTNEIDEIITNYELYRKGIMTPVGMLPQIGNQPYRNYDAVWRSDEIAAKYMESLSEENLPYEKSVYFPMSGTAIMRSGDGLFDTYACMYTQNVRANGHKSANTNSFWLYSKGRLLITSGDTPWYDVGFCPDEWLDEYEKINNYFAEASTYKSSTVIVNGKSQSYTNNGKRREVINDTPIDAKWHSSENFDYSEGYWDGGYEFQTDISHRREVIYSKTDDIFIITDTMTDANENKNDYRQIWCFPEYYPEVKLNGFAKEDVIVDSENDVIYTNDSGSPNVYILNFSAEGMQYKKYYGNKLTDLGIYIGWGGLTYNKDVGRIPKNDIHVQWTSSSSVSKMISVLVPSDGVVQPYTVKKDLSDQQNGISGFEIVLNNGHIYKYMTAGDKCEYEIGGEKLNCCSVLYNENNKTGLIFGASGYMYENFEFEMINGKITEVSEIKVPDTFEWEYGAPVYK